MPRISPDGKYLLFTLADYGQFHIWHKSADLWLLPLSNEEPDSLGSHSSGTHPITMTSAHPLEAVNSTEAESYHAWSSNGRWILCSSRRDDGNYTRLYISYFDRYGQAHHPFRLPQRTADADDLLLRSYNAAEFMVQPVQATSRHLTQAIKADARPATYAGSALFFPEADTTLVRAVPSSAERQSASVGY